MKIDVICNDGSPLGVTEKTMRGEDGRMGVGGAELSLLTMCSAWQYYGNKVTLYNDPKEGGASSFDQKTLAEFNPGDDRDVLIVFRSPNKRVHGAKGKKVWWSCDSYTVDDFRAFRGAVDKVVCISPHHAKYFKSMYGIADAVTIDLPVRTWEYKSKEPKVSRSCIFTSIPDRGVMELHAAWARIVAEVPDASLTITSDWRLWADWATEEQIRKFKLAYSRLPNVSYLGAVKREQLVRVQQSAEVHLYPCIFEEMFCISVAESQVAGAVPITSDYGALPTTNMGVVIHGNPSSVDWQDVFVKNAVEMLTNDKLRNDKMNYLKEVSRNRFSIEKILRRWEEEVFDA